MSYSGTVRCGHCYNAGHNRLGCPERRRLAKENPESYTGRKWHREQEERRQQIASRVCSYCKEPNHNRRGCKVLKEDKRLIAGRQREYRREFFHATSSIGFGPGALVKVPKGNSRDEGGVWSRGTVEMVTDINWVNLDFLLKDTDINRDWRTRDRQIARTRVVSTFGYEEADDNGWQRTPKHNDASTLNAVHLARMIPAAFSDEADNSYGEPHIAELVGPVGFVPAPSDSLELIGHNLEETFNLSPGTRAKDYEKSRLALSSTRWSKVRKSEHEKAIAEHIQ